MPAAVVRVGHRVLPEVPHPALGLRVGKRLVRRLVPVDLDQLRLGINLFLLLLVVIGDRLRVVVGSNVSVADAIFW